MAAAGPDLSRWGGIVQQEVQIWFRDKGLAVQLPCWCLDCLEDETNDRMAWVRDVWIDLFYPMLREGASPVEFYDADVLAVRRRIQDRFLRELGAADPPVSVNVERMPDGSYYCHDLNLCVLDEKGGA